MAETTQERELYYYGGNGWESAHKVGIFEVKATETKTFTNINDAKKYYESLNEEKACWDLTTCDLTTCGLTTILELIECHTFEPPSDDLELPF